jgi:uncharacterized membrane protein SpoIIM required for sporulation
MRETKFIAQQKDKWELFEYYIDHNERDPEKLNEMYIQISDDLSYARTFYPNRSVRVYLNQLALKISASLFKTKRSPWKKFQQFWTLELPQLVWESRWEFVIAFGVFLLAALVGALSTAIDPDFPRLILGNDYVDMTLKNIENGDPMAVYKSGWAVTDTLGITANNIFVSFLTFFLGLLGSIGTIVMLLRNGIMLGAFQYFFIQKGVFWQSFLAIWLHGTLEISAIVIAGAAGITLGKGLLFPGSFRRIQAFQRSARRGFKIMMGIVPVLMIAGTVEGFLTRYTDAPAILRLGFILVSLAFIIFYFMWLPYQNHLTVKEKLMIDKPLTPDPEQVTEWNKIRSTSVIFSDTFLLFSNVFGSLLKWIFIGTLAYALMTFLLCAGEISNHFIFRHFENGTTDSIFLFLLNFPIRIVDYVTILSPTHAPLLGVVHVLILAVVALMVFYQIKKEEKITPNTLIIKMIGLFFPLAACQFLFLLNNTALNFCLLLTLPFWLLWMWDALISNRLNPIHNFLKAFSTLKSSFLFSVLSAIFLLIAGATIYALLNLLDSYIWGFIELHLLVDAVQLKELETLFRCSIGFLSFLMTFALLLIGAGFNYYTLLEIGSAEALLTKINNINLQRQLRGLARE